MRIFTEQVLKAYAEKHPDSKVALQEWATIVKRSEWTCFANIKGYISSKYGPTFKVPREISRKLNIDASIVFRSIILTVQRFSIFTYNKIDGISISWG